MSFNKNKINSDGSINLYKYTGEDLKEYSGDTQTILNAESDKIRICFLDTETTGVNREKDYVIEIALKCIEINKLDGYQIYGYGFPNHYEIEYEEIKPSSEKIGLISLEKYCSFKNKSIDSISPMYLMLEK